MHLPYTLVKPIITEQSLAAAKAGRYTFEVALQATKGQVKEAIETYFKVNVTKVRTTKLAGKRRRVGRTRQTVVRPDRKKALVELKKGQTIDIFDIQE